MESDVNTMWLEFQCVHLFPDNVSELRYREHNFSMFLSILQSLAVSKQLLRSLEKEKLHEVNKRECETLRERWLSEECVNAIVSFFQKKSKL